MTLFEDIDTALAKRDIKQAEVSIAKYLRGECSTEERAELLFRRAQARLLDARPDDAFEDVQECITLMPNFADQPRTDLILGDIYFARFELAAVGFMDRENADLALSYYQKLLDSPEPINETSWVHYQVGRICLSRDEPEQAVEHFQKSLMLQDYPPATHALTYERLGFIHLYEYREAKQALHYFQQAQQQYPETESTDWQIQLALQMSRAYFELRQIEDALRLARLAVRLASEDSSTARTLLPEAYMTIGDIFAALPGKEEEAIEHYLNFLQTSARPIGINVTWSQVHHTIGELCLRLGRYQQAAQSFQKAIQFNPYHPWELQLRFQIARCYYRIEAYERSAETLEDLLRHAKQEGSAVQDWRIFDLLGNTYYALGQYKDAVKAYEKALKYAPSRSQTDRIHKYLDISQRLLETNA